MQTVPGLYRPSKGGQVIECSYNFDTGVLAELQFESPIPYLSDWINSKPVPPLGAQYNAFLRSDALGMYVISNTYLAFVYPDKITGFDWNNPPDQILYPCDVKYPKRLLVPIGYRKTVVPTLAAPIVPYKLFYNPETKEVFDDGMWVPLKEEPMYCEDLSLYKQLLDTPYTFIYKTKKGGICYG